MIIKQSTMASFGTRIMESGLPFYLLGGASTGAVGGTLYSAIKHRDTVNKLNTILVEENLTDTKAFVKKHAPDINTITSREDLGNSDMDIISKGVLETFFNGDKPSTSLYVPDIKALIAPETASKDILGHEIGHHIDFKKHGIPYVRSLLPTGVADIERSAWRESPIQNTKAEGIQMNMREHAASSFKKGVAAGTLAGAIIALAKIMKRKAL